MSEWVGSAYGIEIGAPYPLWNEPSTRGTPELVVRTASPDAAPPDPAPNTVLLAYRRSGRFAVRDGKEIVTWETPDRERTAFRQALLGPVLAAACRQRGFLVLHGSCVEIAARAVVLVGRSGAGKSTVAACLHKRGHALISDGMTVLRQGARGAAFEALPGIPELKLWPDALRYLGRDPEQRERALSHLDKRLDRVDERFACGAVPVGLIASLEGLPEPALTPLSGAASIVELLSHLYPATAATVPEHRTLREITELAARSTVARLSRGDSLATVVRAAELLELELRSVQS